MKANHIRMIILPFFFHFVNTFFPFFNYFQKKEEKERGEEEKLFLFPFLLSPFLLFEKKKERKEKKKEDPDFLSFPLSLFRKKKRKQKAPYGKQHTGFCGEERTLEIHVHNKKI